MDSGKLSANGFMGSVGMVMIASQDGYKRFKLCATKGCIMDDLSFRVPTTIAFVKEENLLREFEIALRGDFFRVLSYGAGFFTTKVSPKYDIPGRKMHGTTEVVKPKGWDTLAKEIKNLIYENVLATIPVDLEFGARGYGHHVMALAYTNKENYSELPPMLYSSFKTRFDVCDFDFSAPIKFIMGLSNQARFALLHSKSLLIHITFSDNDHIEGHMLNALFDWLNVCTFINRQVRVNAFNGVRIPWKYYADDTDEFAHIEAEFWMRRAPYLGERRQEWAKILAAMYSSIDEGYRRRNTDEEIH